MRVLLAFPPVPPALALQEMRSRPPLGVYVLAGALRAWGIDVGVADPSLLETFLFAEGSADQGLAALLRGVDVLGVSCHTFNWGVGRLLVERARRLAPGLKIVLGGLHPSLFPSHALRVTGADFVVMGEGELALPALVRSLDARSAVSATVVPGVMSRPAGAKAEAAHLKPARPRRLTDADLAAVEPAYDLVPRAYRSVSVESSRGCLHACTFCSVPHHGSWRGLAPDVVASRVVRALAAAGRGAGAGAGDVDVFIVDDCFTVDPARALAVLNGIGRLGARAIMEGRIDDVLAPGFIEAVPWNAVRSLQFGVECGYDEGLRRIGKGITLDAVEEALGRIAAAGAAGSVVVSFIVGFPWETEAEWTRTIHYAADISCRFGVRASTNVFGLFPSTIWDHREQYGIDADEGVFDGPFWMLDEGVFFRLHPNLDARAYGRIQSLTGAYGLAGFPVVNTRQP